MDYDEQVRRVDGSHLLPVVRSMLGGEIVLDSWQHRSVGGGWTAAGAVHRFEGTLRRGVGHHRWSVILKILLPSGGSFEPGDWRYWKREALAYSSGLLSDLPGRLKAPKCFGADERLDGAMWLWLEDLGDAARDGWSQERYALAAYHLGSFNGAYLAGRPIPRAPWLSHGQVPGWLTSHGALVVELQARRNDPLVRRLWPDDTVERVVKMWEDRDSFLTVLRQLPVTFCHHDAFRRNLSSRLGSDGIDETVAIDWGFAGVGAVGEELWPLIMSSALFFDISLAEMRMLDRIAFDAYVVGLRQAGWDGDPRLARLGYAIACALIMGLHSSGMSDSDDSTRRAIEAVTNRSYDDAMGNIAELRRFGLERADEARELITVVD